MNALYISADFSVSEMIRDEAVIERFEKDPEGFLEEWQENIRAGLKAAKGKDVDRPRKISTSLYKQIELGEEARG